ncbi:alpha/beta fold hydrolase [Roseovarius salinarum]|uniref:alpha/beta fold hydrolase n=1 Tax=Roseovarius salinarum TaxID=1981892 RepID=UPI000C342F56|nr:alpha/beta fold hydrolase [Roseovarius salinarum]
MTNVQGYLDDPLVLLPGMMCDARVFGPQIDALSTVAAVTVAPITRGERIEEIASGLLDLLPARFALAGLSMGGIVAMEILRRAPDRVSRLALLDTNALAETPASAAAYEPLVIKARSGSLAEVAGAMIGPGTLAPGACRPDVMKLMAEMAEHVGGAAVVRQIRALQRRQDYQATLRRCRVPALVLCGAHDTLTPPRRHELMAALIPGAELEVVEDAGHLPTLETPDAVTRALAGWAARRPAPQ